MTAQTIKQALWKLALTHDELIALARAIDTQMELLACQPNSDDKATTYLNLCRVVAKMPEEKWFDVQEVNR